MKAFINAVSFLTTLPVSGKAHSPDVKMVFHFPLVGLLIGLLLIAVDYLGSQIFSDATRACVDVLFLIAITGGIHMDGLGDTSDGVFSHKDKNRILEIMKDPRMGVMGTLAIIFCILFKVNGLAQIPFDAGWIFLLMIPALARCSQVIGLAFMQNARGESSLGASMYPASKTLAVGWAFLCLVPAYFPGWKSGIAVTVVFIVSNFIILSFMQKKIGGMTGDTLGALTEVVETSLFLSVGEIYRGGV